MLHSKVKINSKYFTLLSLSILVSGCSMIPSVDTYETKSFNTGKKGVAILRVSEHASYLCNETDMSLTYNIKKIGDDKAAKKSGVNSFAPGFYNSHDYTTDVMMLDPGIYYIDHMQLNEKHRGNYVIRRSFPGPGIKKLQGNSANKYMVKIGAFEVKPGKVTYFGHANLSEDSNLPFNMKNELNKVKSDLKNGPLSELSDRIEQGQFIQPGSVIVDQAGNYSIINSNEIFKKSMSLINKATDDLIAKK